MISTLPGGEPDRFHDAGLGSTRDISGDLGEQRGGQRTRQHLGSTGHGADRGEEFLERGILHDEARRPGPHEVRDILLDGQQSHDDHPRGGHLAMDGGGEAETVVILQPEVEQYDIRLRFAHFLERFVGIGGCRQHPEAGLSVNHRRDALAQQPVVLDEHERDGRRRRGGTDGSFSRRGLRLACRFLLHGVPPPARRDRRADPHDREPACLQRGGAIGRGEAGRHASMRAPFSWSADSLTRRRIVDVAQI